MSHRETSQSGRLVFEVRHKHLKFESEEHLCEVQPTGRRYVRISAFSAEGGRPPAVLVSARWCHASVRSSLRSADPRRMVLPRFVSLPQNLAAEVRETVYGR